MPEANELGFIGLGKMGQGMVGRLLDKDFKVVPWDISQSARDKVSRMGAQTPATLTELVSSLKAPRNIWLMVPHQAVDESIDALAHILEPEDLVADGGNSFYEDTLRRGDILKARGIHFIDVGVSGGPGGAKEGACLMAGGEAEDYLRMLPFIRTFAAPHAYKLLGELGSGHYAKMIHNGIEYGMMQAIAEGFKMLEASNFSFNPEQVAELYNNRTVIAGRLIGWTQSAFSRNPNLENISHVIGHTGEGQWTVDTARKMGISLQVIEASFQVRVDSINVPDDMGNLDNYSNRLVSQLRNEFGGHSTAKS